MVVMVEQTPRHEREPLPDRYAIGIAGQGGTNIGEIYKGMYDTMPAFKKIFDEAEELLASEMDGFSIQALCFENDPEKQKLAQKRVEQTAYSHLVNTTIYAAKYAAFAEEYKGFPLAEFILPQSAGECAALYISGMTDFKTALLIAKKRGELTEKAAEKNPGRMVYVAGLHGGYEKLQQVCDEVQTEALNFGIEGVVAVANRNAPDIQIYTGTDHLVSEVSRRLNKKVIDLPISFGSHCSLMEPMVVEFFEYLQTFKFNSPVMRWILNGRITNDPDEIIECMARGPARMVDYQASVEELGREGVAAMVEMIPNTKDRAVVGRYVENTMQHLEKEFQLILR